MRPLTLTLLWLAALAVPSAAQAWTWPVDGPVVRSFDFVTMVVLGGLGSITGSVLAAVVLTALPEILRSSLGAEFNQYRLVTYALLLIILMLVRPQGIFGRGELSLARLFRRKSAGTTPAAPSPFRCVRRLRSCGR